MMLDPAYRKFSLPKVCERVGLRVTDLADFFRGFYVDAALLSALRRLPQITKDLAQDALSQWVLCERCDGITTVQDSADTSRVCPACEGSGKVRQPGDPQARRLLAEMAGLIRRNGRR